MKTIKVKKVKVEIIYIELNACEVGHALGMKAGTPEQECWCATCELFAAKLTGKDEVVLNMSPDYLRIARPR